MRLHANATNLVKSHCMAAALSSTVTEWPCRSYLEGQRFTIKTENRNLLNVSMNPVQRNDKIIRWLQFLANFNYVVEHVKGTENRAINNSNTARYQNILLSANARPVETSSTKYFQYCFNIRCRQRCISESGMKRGDRRCERHVYCITRHRPMIHVLRVAIEISQ